MSFWEQLLGPSKPYEKRRRILLDYGNNPFLGGICEYIVVEETETAYFIKPLDSSGWWISKDDKRIKEIFWK